MERKKLIKVATMTFHMAHNYGAMLQAYALETVVNRLGASCEVLDYRYPYIDQWSGIRTLGETQQESGFMMGTLKYLKRYWKSYRKADPKRRKFNTFMRQDLKLSRKTYFQAEQLRTATYDAVLFGSDQIWNQELTGRPAPEYMGKYFDAEKVKLIAYAASAGTDAFQENLTETYYPLLKRFTALGIREKGLADFISQKYQLSVQTVLDPVFLLEKEDWMQVSEGAEITIDEPYLLVYAFQVGEDIYQLARKIAKERKLKLVAIGYQERDFLEDMLQLTECGPKDFVSLIQNAAFVCTTSFHGMAFSVIFEKDFYCIGHPKYSKRNSDFLSLAALTDRMVSKASDVVCVENCDYAKSREALRSEKQKSLEFLRKSIFEVRS